jgi:hypothetical protein
MPKEAQSVVHHFNQLPLELRLKIWACALPAPQIVDIVATSSDENQQLFSLPSELGEEGRIRTKVVRSFVDHVQTLRPNFSALLHVNRQTRDLVLKRWRFLGVPEPKDEWDLTVDREEIEMHGEGSTWRSSSFMPPEVQDDGRESMFYLAPPPPRHNFTLFNPELDVLFLADPPSTRRVSSLSVLVRWLDPSVIENVTGLAIPYYSWRKDKTFKHLGLLLKFKSLRRLWVCFVGDRPGMEGWLSAIEMERDGSEEGYIKDVRKQVWGDIEELERKEVGWKRPWVGVVRDRGAVMDDLTEEPGSGD